MLRIMASSEGEGNEPYRMKPCLMTKPGVYNEEIFRGLDYFLDALSKRGFTAIGTFLWKRLKRKGKRAFNRCLTFGVHILFFSDIDQSVALEWRVSIVKWMLVTPEVETKGIRVYFPIIQLCSIRFLGFGR